jgi:hypothetical protein
MRGNDVYQTTLLQTMICWKWLPGVYIKQDRWGIEQDSGETGRE